MKLRTIIEIPNWTAPPHEAWNVAMNLLKSSMYETRLRGYELALFMVETGTTPLNEEEAVIRDKLATFLDKGNPA